MDPHVAAPWSRPEAIHHSTRRWWRWADLRRHADAGVARWTSQRRRAALHLHAAQRREISERQGNDLGRRPRHHPALQEGQPERVAVRRCRQHGGADPYTFVIKLNKPNALLVEILKTPTYPFSIIPAEQKDKPGARLDIIGTGPYQIAEWVKDDHLTLRRNEGYVADESAKGPDGYAGRSTAYLDTVRYNFVPEANARIAALQSGDADFISLVPPDRSSASRPAGLRVMTVMPFCQQEFVLHAKNPPTTTR